MRILGIDPGSRNTGLGLVEVKNGQLHCLGYECVKMGNEPLPQRLGTIYRNIEEIIRIYQPDTAAIEQVFVSNNYRSALTLGQARGSAICAAVNAQLPVYEYSALQIKRAVVGTGGAKKEQVQHMVRVLLGFREPPKSDEADALACAICHIHTAQVESRLNRAAI